MLEGVAYIHHCKYVHRDVKPSNILITYSGDLKIADFGFSKPMTGANTFSISDAGKGTVGWMAPELLRAMEDAENSQNFKLVSVRATPAIDVFPLGCVFYFFLTKGQHPFGYCHARNLNIINGKHNLSGEFSVVLNSIHPESKRIRYSFTCKKCISLPYQTHDRSSPRKSTRFK